MLDAIETKSKMDTRPLRVDRLATEIELPASEKALRLMLLAKCMKLSKLILLLRFNLRSTEIRLPRFTALLTDNVLPNPR